MTRPPEIAALERAARLLIADEGEVAEAGERMLEWIADDCPQPVPDFLFFLKKPGKRWREKMLRHGRDELLRRAARLHFGDRALDEQAGWMTRHFNRYRKDDWPGVRLSDECPYADNDSLRALLWRALKKWPGGEMKRITMKSILGSK